MPQEDNETAELEHSEKIALVIFPAADESAEIVEPGKEALDFPAPAIMAQFAAVLGTLVAGVLFGGGGAGAVCFAAGGGGRGGVGGEGADQSVLVWLRGCARCEG